ncbi:hypothetical protein XANCAGTX0491_006050 [Xanthoria calcicola]
MSVAIIDGLLRPGISPSDVTGSCVTGNCTWQDYQSMGVCSTITDVSSTITAKCRKRTTQFYPAGCNYSVPAINRNPTARKTVLQASKLGQTLWVGASDTQDYTSLGLNTLIQFYMIYVPDFIIWDSLDPTEDHKDELVALQATLSLCLNKYHTDMTFGVTDTNLISKETDLDWQTSSETFEPVSFDTVTVTHDAETFWMSGLNQGSFYKYLSLQTFTGSASMRSEEPDGGGNFTENDVVRVIAASLYDDRAGMPRLTKLLDNLAVSMSKALRTTTDVPDNIRGTPSSFEVYIQIEWAWLIVPIAAVGLSLIFLLLTMYLSRKRKIPAWKSSLLAVLLGLTSEARRDWGTIRRPREMEETAKARSIRLEANGGQWQMVKAD